MSDVTGPVPTLPGATSSPPKDQMCDEHPDLPAVRRVQGETDSFGAEYHDLCQECLDEMKASESESLLSRGPCDWCRNHADRLSPRRDYDEGMCGPVYYVCSPCIQKRDEEDRKEMEDDGVFDQYWYDDYPDDIDDE